MRSEQLNLDIWRDEYSYPFLELNNLGIKDLILKYNDSFVISGSRFSGKKHLSFYISNKKNINFYVLSSMSDVQIISLYDQLKNNNETAFWILDDDINFFSKDVNSRIKSLMFFSIKSLDMPSLKILLKHRLSVIGVKFDEKKIRYCLERLSIDYSGLEKFINFIKTKNCINFKDLKIFFDQL